MVANCNTGWRHKPSPPYFVVSSESDSSPYQLEEISVVGEELTQEELRLLEHADGLEARSRLWLYLMFFLLLCAVGVFAWQCITWLKTADWLSPALSTLGAAPLGTAWQGVNEVYQFIIEAPLALVSLFSALVAGWVGTLGDDSETDELRAARMKRARSQSNP